MNYNNLENSVKYFAGEHGVHFGLSVDTVGFQSVKPGEHYPPTTHPSGFYFNTVKGRTLQEYQLLYITKGSGTFASAHRPDQPLEKGSLVCLFPDEWHTYHPNEKNGWNEYYIGFNGAAALTYLDEAGITPENPILKVGFNADLVRLFQEAIEVGKTDKNAVQERLSSIIVHILGLACYLSRNNTFEDDNIGQKIERAKIIMIENLYKEVDVEELAAKLNLSYSWFRKLFKEYTGYAPAKYYQELKIKKAEDLLVHTSFSVKEIAYILNYKSSEHFFSLFKKKNGFTPLEYRVHIRGSESGENVRGNRRDELPPLPEPSEKLIDELLIDHHHREN